MKNFNDNKWLTTETLVDHKKNIRTITNIGELSSIFNNIYQDLYATIDRDYRNPENNSPYTGNDEYRKIIKEELNHIRKIYKQIKKYILDNELQEHIGILYPVVDQLLELHYEAGIRYKKRLREVSHKFNY